MSVSVKGVYSFLFWVKMNLKRGISREIEYTVVLTFELLSNRSIFK